MIDSGNYRFELDADAYGGSYWVHKHRQGPVRLLRRGFTLRLDASEVRPAQVCVVPALQNDAATDLVFEDVALAAQMHGVRTTFGKR